MIPSGWVGIPVFKAVRVTGNKPRSRSKSLLYRVAQRRVAHSLPQLAYIFLADLAENAIRFKVIKLGGLHRLELEIEVEFVLVNEVLIELVDVGTSDVVVGFAVVGAAPQCFVRDVRIEAGIFLDFVFDEEFLNRVEFAAVLGIVEAGEGYVDNHDGSLFEVESKPGCQQGKASVLLIDEVFGAGLNIEILALVPRKPLKYEAFSFLD